MSPPLAKWFQMASTWDFRGPVIMGVKVGNEEGNLLHGGVHRTCAPPQHEAFVCFAYFVCICDLPFTMASAHQTYTKHNSSTKPSKKDQELALASYDAPSEVLKQLRTENPKIEIEETGERITVPRSALELLRNVLELLSQGKAVSVYSIAAEMTTQAAAELLNCRRPTSSSCWRKE